MNSTGIQTSMSAGVKPASAANSQAGDRQQGQAKSGQADQDRDTRQLGACTKETD